ncbi:hypothetical protein ACC676_08745 [Rhizobium ruizarguesonis]
MEAKGVVSFKRPWGKGDDFIDMISLAYQHHGFDRPGDGRIQHGAIHQLRWDDGNRLNPDLCAL